MTDQETKGKILLVDDDQNVLLVTRKLLEMSGYTVVSAGNGREGLELFAASADDFLVALVDLTMPEMDGVAVCEAIHRTHPDLRVILLSGQDQPSAEARYGGKGFAGFLQKPYTSRILVHKIEEVVGR